MDLIEIVSGHWFQLRKRTYDLLSQLEAEELQLKLGFERSQSVGYQFWCMLGAQESWISLIETGEWNGFSCSVTTLEGGNIIADFRGKMERADERLLLALDKADLTQPFDGGGTSLTHYMTLVEHESHHQGQLINFIYAHELPIPDSWEAKWGLARD